MIAGVVASQIVIPPIPTIWTYIGTSGSNNGSVAKESTYNACDTTTGVRTWLTSNYPVSNYTQGYIMRVTHSYYDDFFQIFECTSYFYRAD